MRMPTITNKPKARTWRLRPEDVRALRASVSKASGLRVDVSRLDDEEAAELMQLVREIEDTAEAGVVRSDPGALGDMHKLKRWEVLVSRAAGRDDDYFDRRREIAALAAEAHIEAERKAKPPRQPRLEAENTIVLPPVVFNSIAAGEMQIAHAVVLLAVVGQIENGPFSSRYARVENGTLILPSVAHLTAPFDAEGDVRHIEAATRELADAGVLDVKRSGGEVRIRVAGVVAEELKRRKA